MNCHAVYVIHCAANNKVYVGSAVNVNSRLHTHKSNLKLNKHHNKHLQSAYNLYGIDQFEFKILEVVIDKKDLLDRETAWIKQLNSSNRKLGFNRRLIANSNLGIKKPHSAETIIKIGLGNKGKKISSEAIEKMRLKLKGRKQSPEHIANAIEGRKLKSGFAQSESNKIKIGKANSKPDLWPHVNKSFCKCRECLDKKNEQRKIRTKIKADKRKQNKLTKLFEGAQWIGSISIN